MVSSLNPSCIQILPPTPSTERGRNIHISEQANRLLYGSQGTVIILDLDNPSTCDIFVGHNRSVTCAKFSPNGYWVASGDASGNVKIWAPNHADKLIKYETQMFSGPVRDIAWNPDSDRVAFCGESAKTFAQVIMYDTGNTVGKLDGHAKTVLSIDIRPKRPYRLITGSEDLSINFYEGPPFKYKSSIKTHENFVNCVRFSPDGERFASVSSDKKIILAEAGSGEEIAVLQAENGHTGSIMSLSWLPDSARFLTASLDKTVKLWDGSNVLQTLVVDGNSVEHQQVAVIAKDEGCISVSLRSTINQWFSFDSPEPNRYIHGHQENIIAMELVGDTFITGDTAGRLLARESLGEARLLDGRDSLLVTIKACPVRPGTYAVAFVKNLISIYNVESPTPTKDIAVDSQPFDMAYAGETLVVLTHQHGVQFIEENGDKESQGTPNNARHMAVASKTDIWFGCTNGKIQHINGTELNGHQTEVTCISVSPDGAFLASGDTNRYIMLWNAKDNTLLFDNWCYHCSRVTSLAFSPNSTRLLSGSIDCTLIIWDVNGTERKIFNQAQRNSVRAVKYLNENTVASSGGDNTVKIWQLS